MKRTSFHRPVKMCQVLVVIAGILTLGGPVLAQVAVIEADTQPAPKPFDVELGYGYQANTDLKKSSGDFHRNSFRAIPSGGG